MNRTFVGIFVSAMMAVPAVCAEPVRQVVLSSIAVDFDDDGRMDRAELVVINPASADVDFGSTELYMVGESERVDLVLTFDAASGKPTFVKKKIVDPEIVFGVAPLESKDKGSVSVTSCYGCGAMKSWQQTLTIAYRRDQFVVAGLIRGWEWGTHLADGNVKVILGDCDINYLTGKGKASNDFRDAKPVRMKFKRTKLADWSDAKVPKVCRFY